MWQKKDKFFWEMASLVYQQYAKQTSETTKIAALCLEVDAIEKEIRETKEKIRKNSGKKVCSACGSTLAVKASFCPFCGAKQAESGAPTPVRTLRRTTLSEIQVQTDIMGK